MILENYKSGNLIKSTAGYKYFLPTKINEEWIEIPESWQCQRAKYLMQKTTSSVKLV